jgi:hypothetical protein
MNAAVVEHVFKHTVSGFIWKIKGVENESAFIALYREMKRRRMDLDADWLYVPQIRER